MACSSSGNLEYHEEYATNIYELLKSDYRVEIDLRNEKLSYKMRESVVRKIPITVIIGQKEVDNQTVSYRKFGSEETITVSNEEFMAFLKQVNHNKE